MQALQGRRKILVVLVAVFVLLALFGGIAIVAKGASGIIEDASQNDPIVQANDQVGLVPGDETLPGGLQSQELDAPVTTTPSLLSRLDRRHLVALSVGGFLLLAAIAAAVTVGILYHQEQVAHAESVANVNEELKRLDQELEKLKSHEETPHSDSDQKAATELENAKYRFKVQVGVFGVLLALGLVVMVSRHFGKYDSSKAIIIYTIVLQLIATLVMALIDGATGGWYCASALPFTLFLGLVLWVGAKSGNEASTTHEGTSIPNTLSPNASKIITLGFLVLLSIGPPIASIIHMAVTVPG